MGAGPALALVQQDAPPSQQSEYFRAAVAYYPWCGDKSGVMTVPVLIVIGEADDWCPADLCKRWPLTRAMPQCSDRHRAAFL